MATYFLTQSNAGLDELEPGAVGAVQEDGDSIPYLRFQPDAQTLAARWRDELEARLRSEAMTAMPAFESHLAKYRSLFPALALLLHLVAVVTGAQAGGVSLEAAQLAAAWCEYLEEHAKKLYAAEVAPGLDAARALAEHLQAGDVRDGQSVRDLYLPGWAGLATVARVDAALTVLEGAGWLRVSSLDTGGRPSRVVSLHPDFREAGND